MTLPVPLIDHVVVNVRDGLDQAAGLWTRLGFQLTPRGHHTLGSSNNLAILGTDYIELLGVAPGANRTDVLDWPAGLNGLVFKTADSDRLYATLSEAGVPVLPPQAFSRPVDMGGDQPGSKHPDAAFRTVRLERDAVPSGRMFFCHHLTPDLVWHDPWRRHPNGATGIHAFLIAATDPAAYAALFALMFGEAAVRPTPTGFILTAGLASIVVDTPDALAFSDLGDRSSAMAGLVIRTASLERTRAALGLGGFEAPAAGPLTIPPTLAGGLTLTFVE